MEPWYGVVRSDQNELGIDAESWCELNRRPQGFFQMPACLRHRGVRSVFAGLWLPLLVVIVVATVAIGHRSRLALSVSSSEIVMEVEKNGRNSCSRLPFLDIEAVMHNNLGNHGPDVGAEGIYYKAKTHNVKLNKSGSTEGWLRLRATSDYTPFWPADNGVKGNLATFNLKAGTDVDLELEAYDPETDKPVEIPYGSLTFFDVDQGPGESGREFIQPHGFRNFYVANGTELYLVHEGWSTKTKGWVKGEGFKTFLGTKSMFGSDNPDDAWVLGPRQKQKALTIEFKNLKKLRFTVGATNGPWPRYFEFSPTPSLVCAQTKLKDGRLVSPLEDVAGNPRPLTNDKQLTKAFAGVSIKDLKGPGTIDEKLADEKQKKEEAEATTTKQTTTTKGSSGWSWWR